MRLAGLEEFAGLRRDARDLAPYLDMQQNRMIASCMRKVERMAPGSDRTKRLRKKRAKALGEWRQGREFRLESEGYDSGRIKLERESGACL